VDLRVHGAGHTNGAEDEPEERDEGEKLLEAVEHGADLLAAAVGGFDFPAGLGKERGEAGGCARRIGAGRQLQVRVVAGQIGALE